MRTTRSELATQACFAAAAGLLLAWAALLFGDPRTCMAFGVDSFFKCGLTGWLAALGDAGAAATSGVLAITVIPAARPVLRRFGRVVGMAGATVAATAALVLPIGPSEMAWRVGDAGWFGIGAWLAFTSSRRTGPLRSVLGTILGATLCVWAALNIAADDPLVVVGGVLFPVPFGIWAYRAGSRISSEWEWSPPSRRSGLERGLRVIVVGLVSVLVVLPLWIVSTIGGPVMGDPTISLNVRNETDRPIYFFIQRTEPQSRRLTQTGESFTASRFAAANYSVAAQDLDGNWIWCRSVSAGELRRMRYELVITSDPASCQ